MKIPRSVPTHCLPPAVPVSGSPNTPQTGAERADAAEALRRGFRVRAAGPRMDELRGWLHFRRAADVHVDPVLGQADREVCPTNGAERDLPKNWSPPKSMCDTCWHAHPG